MLKSLQSPPASDWLPAFFTDFRRRLVNLLGYELRTLAPSVALSLLHNKTVSAPASTLTAAQLSVLLTPYDTRRLELYSNNMADHHLVTDLLPVLARLVLTQQLGDLHLSPVQQVQCMYTTLHLTHHVCTVRTAYTVHSTHYVCRVYCTVFTVYTLHIMSVHCTMYSVCTSCLYKSYLHSFLYSCSINTAALFTNLGLAVKLIDCRSWE